MSDTDTQFIESVKAELGDGADRIANRPHPFRHTWWPQETTFEEQLLSDHAMTEGQVPMIEAEFKAEVAAIRSLLEASSEQSAPEHESDHSWVLDQANSHARALKIWEWIAFPVRRIGEQVFRVRSPRDVMGSAIVQSMPVDEYIAALATRTAHDAAAREELRQQVTRWRLAAIVFGIGVLLLAIAAY